MNFSPSGFIASEFQQYNIDNLYDSTFHQAISAVLIKKRTNVCHGITAHTLWRYHGEHQVNMESFRVLFTCQVRCYVHVLPKRRRGFGGVVNFLPFIIKCIFGIKCISPCSFGNKRMRLLTRVYGMSCI